MSSFSHPKASKYWKLKLLYVITLRAFGHGILRSLYMWAPHIWKCGVPISSFFLRFCHAVMLSLGEAVVVGSQADVLHTRISEDVVTLATTAAWKQTKILLSSSCEFLPSGLNAADNGVGCYASDSESFVPDGITASHRSWKHLKMDKWLLDHNILIRNFPMKKSLLSLCRWDKVDRETRLRIHYLFQRSWQWHDQ